MPRGSIRLVVMREHDELHEPKPLGGGELGHGVPILLCGSGSEIGSRDEPADARPDIEELSGPDERHDALGEATAPDMPQQEVGVAAGEEDAVDPAQSGVDLLGLAFVRSRVETSQPSTSS